MSAVRPRRSLLYMPASNPRALEKAKALLADGFIFDLEDAVAPERKLAARDAAVLAAQSRSYGQREVLIRVNGLETQWAEADLAAVASSGADGVVLPKVSSAADIEHAAALLARSGAPSSLALWAMIETPRGVQSVDAIADVRHRQTSHCLAGIIVGTADLAKELRCQSAVDRAPLLYALSRCVLAARASGIAVIDGPHFDLEDEAGLRASCLQGRALGFDGKSLIHPKQIAPVNEAYRPSTEELASAQRIVAAYQQAQSEARGVITVDGRMIEALHVRQAERVLAEAAQMDALSSVGE